MKKEMSSQAAAASMIRAYMKANGYVGSVSSSSYAGGNSVRVGVVDLPPEKLQPLKEYAGQFQQGHFDGMIDLYEYSNVDKSIPQVKFVFVENRASDEMRQSIWDYMKASYAGMEGAPADAKDAGSFRNENFCEYGDRLIYRLFAGGYNNSQYWDSIAAAVA